MPRARRRKGLGLPGLLLGVAAGLALIALGIAVYAESKLSTLVVGGLGESFSTRIYGAPFILHDGTAAAPSRLLERLDRLGYAQVQGEPQSGQYSWRSPALRVSLRGFKTPLMKQEPGVFSLSWTGKEWRLDGAASFALEPEVASELSGARKVRREPAEAAELPKALKDAVVAAEDKRFYGHWGLDPRGALRALLNDVTGRGALQGGSTITQQLSKNLFLSPKRTLRRKFAEAVLAVYLELRYGKEKILALYLNHIYFGQDGAFSVAGVKAAARFYFGKPLNALDAAQCATLAGLIRSPHRYNPFRDPDEALSRRNFVLNRMREEGFISEGELKASLLEPLGARPTKAPSGRDNDYFVAEVVRQLSPRYGEDALFRQGLSVYTTMDPLLQAAAARAVKLARPQGALAAVEPSSGRVLALCGGRDFGQSQFNRATQGLRQPGSAFKPFVYGAALEKGLTPATILNDEPRSYPRAASASTWDPRNYDGVYMGTVTLRTALAHSLNAATLDLADKIGVGAPIAFARRMGIKSPLESSLATVLGSSEVTLLELVAAYAPFANGGFRVSPVLVEGVFDASGDVLEFSGFSREEVLAPAQSYLITSLLQTVVGEGTAKSLPLLGFKRPAAGKTGTTNDGRDAWFVGFTPRLLAGVWVGDDQHRPLKATGARNALPLWASFMREAAADFPEEDFAEPAGLIKVRIDPMSGLRALAGCPQKREELFIAGTQPTQDCPLHEGGLKGWFKRWFSR
ncbi:MAG: PBP1A family penicillin-binding protein [Elusimicrobia bacterium]|nr:PBP1A family penicillin-binding protein [Elusimicrobiota bacterium]